MASDQESQKAQQTQRNPLYIEGCCARALASTAQQAQRPQHRCCCDVAVGSPPECCQSAPLTRAEWDARGRRLEAAYRAARDRQPRCCPNCGSDSVVPVFDPDGILWNCDDCHNVFSEGD